MTTLGHGHDCTSEHCTIGGHAHAPTPPAPAHAHAGPHSHGHSPLADSHARLSGVEDPPFTTRGLWDPKTRSYALAPFTLGDQVTLFHKALDGTPKPTVWVRAAYWVQDFALGLVGFVKGLFSFKS